MGRESFKAIAQKHIVECESVGISLEDATFAIMLMAEDYSDDEVTETFKCLPEDALKFARAKIADYKKTGKYYITSSVGKLVNVSRSMERLSTLIPNGT